MATIDKLFMVFSDSSTTLFRVKYLILSVTVILLGSGCKDGEKQGEYARFYFPYKTLTEGLVYEYESTSKGEAEYWYYKSEKEEEEWLLTGTYYNSFFQVGQFFKEGIYPTGTLMSDYYLYQPDSTGQVIQYDAELIAANGFPFSLKDTNSVLLFALQWTFSEVPLHRISLTRNRQYREKTTFAFRGKRLPAIVFDLRELIDDERVGHLEREYTGMEVYAEGIGLVYYRKEIGDDMVLEYQLKDIYPMADFEKKINEPIK